MKNAVFANDLEYEGLLEVTFPKSITGKKANKDVDIDKFDDLPDLLSELDKRVNAANGSVASLVSFKDDLDIQRKNIEEARRELEDSRFTFEQQMKNEYQKLNDLKIDFEQEKTKVFNDIQNARELLEKNKRNFERYRREQLALIEQNKKLLTKNYEQFEKIVSTFNEKIDKFDIKVSE